MKNQAVENIKITDISIPDNRARELNESWVEASGNDRAKRIDQRH